MLISGSKTKDQLWSLNAAQPGRKCNIIDRVVKKVLASIRKLFLPPATPLGSLQEKLPEKPNPGVSQDFAPPRLGHLNWFVNAKGLLDEKHLLSDYNSNRVFTDYRTLIVECGLHLAGPR